MDKEYSITIDGEQIAFKFKDSLIHATGEHAGNIDAIITTIPPLPQNLLLDELHIKVPGGDEFLYIYGYGVVENSLKATFNSSDLVDTQNLPEIVEVYWGANGEKLIGEMCCQAYSETAESELSELSEEMEEIDEPEELNNIQEAEASTKEEANEKQNEIDSVEKSSPINKLFIIGAVILVLLIAFFIS